MSFVNNITAEIDNLPLALRDKTKKSLMDFSEKINQSGLVLPENEAIQASMAKVWCCSQFITESCSRKPEILNDLIVTGDLLSNIARAGYVEYLSRHAIESEQELMILLRHFRRREMIRIAWRDLAGWEELTETLMDLSTLAEVCIRFALDFLYRQACDRRGTPTLSDGTPQQLVVLGMGKLGARELNYSSDIDLIFAYAEEGQLADRKETTYGEFFSRLSRSLVKVLDEATVDGFVFRTDIRLRPFGDSGPIVLTFDGMENYYQTQAREWERYAMIKVRQVAGDEKTGSHLMVMLKPFVYRRYLDYGAFEELRSLKFQITQELQRKDRIDNIKLGPGGIREIEFIGQAFQLIRGGHEKMLQQRGIIDILRALAELELLDNDVSGRLQEAYVFLRRVENHIQQYQDQQTHDLPKELQVQQILAFSMGFVSWESFKHELDQIRGRVHEVFEQVFSLSQQQENSLESHSLWIGEAESPELLKYLQELGYQNSEQTWSLISGLKNSASVKRLTTKGAGVLNRLMPQLFEMVPAVGVGSPDETLKRILALIEAVAGRNVYLSLLSENPDALSQLVRLTAASIWICDYLSRYPVLFDELLDTRTLYTPLKKADLELQLQQFLKVKHDQDFEQLMITLRQFKHINILRVAAADIMDVIPVMVVSDYLTWIAEVILEQVVVHSWKLLVEKHGVPPGVGDHVAGFAVIGYGKLGGIELGYGSDLDLVYLYDCKDGNASTDGDKPISCAEFYARLGQKVMNMLNSNMLSGMLYEVDMRLRPSGNSGLLVSQVDAYEQYLKNDAWTWEHQALVRGRFITGDPLIGNQFEDIRRKVLSLTRDEAVLKREVREMREKMRDNMAVKEPGQFDLKQSKGGIADIEFIVQFSVLAHAGEKQELVTFTDNASLLDDLLKYGYISEEICESLKKAYCTFRDFGHRETLQGNRAVVAELECAELRSRVEQVWHDIMEYPATN